MMGLSRSPGTKEILATVTKAVLSNKIKYLGIRQMDSTDVSDLDLNLKPVISKNGNQLVEWQNLRLSWFDQMAALNMKIFPKIKS